MAMTVMTVFVIDRRFAVPSSSSVAPARATCAGSCERALHVRGHSNDTAAAELPHPPESYQQVSWCGDLQIGHRTSPTLFDTELTLRTV